MKHTVHSLTSDVLVEMFGDSKDWFSVWKDGKRVASFADLRKRVLKKQVLADQAERRKFHASLAKDDRIREAKMFFTNRFPKADVFINESQPNLHLNGSKFYIICGSGERIRLGVTHATLSFDDMQNLTEMECKQSTSKRHALWSNLTLEAAADLITLLSKN